MADPWGNYDRWRTRGPEEDQDERDAAAQRRQRDMERAEHNADADRDDRIEREADGR